MSIKNLLVAYNGGEASDAALRVAIGMAQKYDAHLTGVLAHGVSRVSRNIPAWFSKEMTESIQGAISYKAEIVAGKFHDMALATRPANKVHWIEVGGDPDQTIADYAMLYDITVVGQYETLAEADELELHPENVALKSGRPVLWVPKQFDVKNMNEHAVLAWDGNRIATRALSGAMTVLETKEKVTVVTVDRPNLGTPLAGIDVTTVLSRHDIPAESKVVTPGRKTTAEVLLAECKAIDARLLVMGAFERSSFRHDFMGGVTTDILSAAQIPVLMSH